MGRVILNLITNAFYAVNEKKKQQPEGYEPTVSIKTKKIKEIYTQLSELNSELNHYFELLKELDINLEYFCHTNVNLSITTMKNLLEKHMSS